MYMYYSINVCDILMNSNSYIQYVLYEKLKYFSTRTNLTINTSISRFTTTRVTIDMISARSMDTR